MNLKAEEDMNIERSGSVLVNTPPMTQLDELHRSLSPALAERTGLLGCKFVPPEGDFVLYWMRTAIRHDENPALNVAIESANELGLPLLVYHGLSERCPFASDRHHTFVLQGARDVQVEFAKRKIDYALHVERSGHRGPHLKTLAKGAAVVVTEDMPTEPLRSWTVALSRGLRCGLFIVDTACVVPMRLVGKSYDRAFAYRNATKRLYEERVSLGPIHAELRTQLPSTIDLPFEPVDLQNVCIDDLVSQCEIDHAIGHVPHSIGGSVAGYQRWQEFKSNGLSSYDRRRNNALVDGVSRMSPYLHYGMVSPMRIAREAAAENTRGADKFLDELLIWRELAYTFCFYRRDHGRISALPRWAFATLSEHESDPRPSLLSWETMSRGRTGDSLWDSAQRALLVHGELHNNVRMTWGKAILNWTADAKQALARTIDLNHRYALDGRDPASYGGILWCLGQFDRPFSPAQPIFGTVRTRSTDQHAKRLDPVAYRRKVARPRCNSRSKVAVIGAGISGLMCARTLADHGFDVTVFEKSRGVSGRMSTRRVDDNLSFDHGAQYFTARDKRFKRFVQSWIHDGLVQKWDGRIVVVENGIVKAEKRGIDRYVAVPGMNSIGKHIASDLSVRLQTEVAIPRRIDDKWVLNSDDGGEIGEFDVVVAAVPASQAAALLAEVPRLADQARAVEMNGCWALMLAFDESLQLGFDGAFVHQSPLSWISRNNSKVGRNGGCETWVIQAAAEWTDANIDNSPEEIATFLSNEFWKAVGCSPITPSYMSTHRWRFAIPKEPLAANCLFDKEHNVGGCGDWCGGPRVEGAFLSGIAIAGRILGLISSAPAGATQEGEQLQLF